MTFDVVTVKPCTLCECVKPLADFYKHSGMADGHINQCKSCRNAYVTKYNAAHPERRKVSANKHASKARATPEHKARQRAWWAAVPGMAMNYYHRDKVDRPDAMARRLAQSAKRRANKLNATPAWVISFFIEEAYRLAQLRTVMTGFRWDVDHTVPLVSKKVCGLHTHDNIQVIPSSVNKSKNNRVWPGMSASGSATPPSSFSLHGQF